MVSNYQYRPPRILLNSGTTFAVDNQTIQSNVETGDSSFNNNMVIILAALLCGMICAVGLSSFLRFALRFRRRFSSQSADQSFVSTGLKKDVLQVIPIAIYQQTAGKTTRAAADCAICLTEFEEGEKIRVLPRCDHCFHVTCVDKWLGTHSSCPTCRQRLLFQHSANNGSGQEITDNSVL